MIKYTIFICTLVFFVTACTNKKNSVNTDNTVQIQQLEKENEELKSLEDDIESDIIEIDSILMEVDK